MLDHAEHRLIDSVQQMFQAEVASTTLLSLSREQFLLQKGITRPKAEILVALQRLVLNRMFDGWKGHLTNAKYAKLAKCSSDTALRDIRELLERGILVQNAGGGRSTSYRLGEPADVRA